MRVIHTSDWHLGQEFYGFDRSPEHEAFLTWLAAQIVELEAEALVVTGDIFDSVNPPVGAQAQLYRFLRDVASRAPHLAIVIIGGNHDSAARIELPRPLLDEARVTLVGGLPRQEGRPVPERVLTVLNDRDGRPAVLCAAVPYLRPADLPTVGEGVSPTRALYERILDSARARASGLPLLVTGHLHLQGGAVSQWSERRIVVGGEEAVSDEIFAPDVAYAALGHLHRPQAVGARANVRYAGSPFPMSCAERTYEHGIVVADFDRGGIRELQTVRIPRHVEFLRAPERDAGTVTDVVELLREMVVEDAGETRRPFLEIFVRLETAEPDMRARFDEALAGKPVRLTRVNRQHDLRPGSESRPDPEPDLEDLNPESVFASCHKREFGTEPPAELLTAFNDLLRVVRNEAHREVSG